MSRIRTEAKVRYGVVGLGHIAQVAILPAFAHTRENSELAALVSGDPEKLKEIGKRYRVARQYAYEEYDQCLRSGEIDAAYIALPNDMHCEFALRAAEAGIHVLCEKPMALTEEECRLMIGAAKRGRVKLMVAYRLHFEEANLEAIEIIRSGRLGDPRIFDSLLTFQVAADSIHVKRDRGGGPLYTIGVYPINAARYLLRSEPVAVFAFSATGADPRFREVEEMTSAILRFPGERLATLTCGFGSSAASMFRVLGSRGDLRVESAYEYGEGITHYLTIGERTKRRFFPKRDPFAAEITYFSHCVSNDQDPEPSGWDGLADIRIIRALYQSMAEKKSVKLAPLRLERRPTIAQKIWRPPVRRRQVFKARA